MYAFLAINFLLMLGLAAAGVWLIRNPRHIQAYILAVYKDPRLARMNPFLGWMAGSSYVTFLRFMGGAFIVFAVLAVYLFLTGGMWR